MIEEQAINAGRMLDRRGVRCVGNLDEPCSRNRGGYRASTVRRCDSIVLGIDDESWHTRELVQPGGRVVAD